MIKKYLNFINEAEQSDFEVVKNQLETDESESSDFIEVKEHLRELIDKTIEKSGDEFKEFLVKFLKNPKDVKINGLISDSDIYEFFLKWRNDIDKKLNDIRFFDETPKDICGTDGVGLYSYIIKSTDKAIFEFVKSI